MENEKLKKENQQVLKENEKAQKVFAEAVTKTEDAKRILAEAKALNDTFDKRVKEKSSRIKQNMKEKLQAAIYKLTITLGIWTWVFCFICMIQTGYILFVNKDIACTIPQWFVNRWQNGVDIAEMIAGLYQWCYGYLSDYMHPYAVIGVMVFVSAGIIAGGFLLFRNVHDRIGEKWHDRWQYHEVTGVKTLRKAVSVALCIVSVSFALIAERYIPVDINVVSWWLIFSVGMNLLYHSCCKRGY